MATLQLPMARVRLMAVTAVLLGGLTTFSGCSADQEVSHEASQFEKNTPSLLGSFSGESFTADNQSNHLDKMLSDVSLYLERSSIPLAQPPGVHFVLSHPFDESKASCLHAAQAVSL